MQTYHQDDESPLDAFLSDLRQQLGISPQEMQSQDPQATEFAQQVAQRLEENRQREEQAEQRLERRKQQEQQLQERIRQTWAFHGQCKTQNRLNSLPDGLYPVRVIIGSRECRNEYLLVRDNRVVFDDAGQNCQRISQPIQAGAARIDVACPDQVQEGYLHIFFCLSTDPTSN